MNITRKSLLITLLSSVLFTPIAEARRGADDGIGHVRQEDRQLDRRTRAHDDALTGIHQHRHKNKQKRGRGGRGR